MALIFIENLNAEEKSNYASLSISIIKNKNGELQTHKHGYALDTLDLVAEKIKHNSGFIKELENSNYKALTNYMSDQLLQESYIPILAETLDKLDSTSGEIMEVQLVGFDLIHLNSDKLIRIIFLLNRPQVTHEFHLYFLPKKGENKIQNLSVKKYV